MKWFYRLSLQWRVTVLTALILTVVSIGITSFSISNGDQLIEPFVEPVADENGVQPAMSTIPAHSTTDEKQQFDKRSMIFCFFSVTVGTVLVYFIAGQAIKPVRELNQEISQINEINLSVRLKQRETNDEISQVTESFNHMLDRLADAFEKQKKFSASAAHELKTPLSTMKTTLQVLERESSPSKQRLLETNQIQLENVNRLSNIVNDLLLIANTARVEAFEKEPVDLMILFNEIIDEVSSFYAEQHISHQIRLEVETVSGQPDLLYRAVYNLVDNAYKYNEFRGAVDIRSYLRNGETVISIKNDGQVISQDERENVLDAFYRIDKSWSRNYSGAGLGLAIVKSIADMHEAQIAINCQDKTEFLVIFKA
ncbi:ATP-binding protein [Carnobacterium divergens]|uniref:histidine kinase n=1 Tax=Carnobacterium divergens TaxID=2748 RepID=A0AAW8R9B0_CARDV|nr:ATP-binding protein [Carnobacterium divergens]MDT1956928.1 ATP-binding protein [Carnobacterium divergens]MDT1972898.1 ATP-binding protein [Carnobacterium divergens]